MKIAIIGSGISGLSSALLLSQKHNITLFEINKRFGGHANTVDIMYKQNLIPVDTGFIVYNKLNYPNLIGFFNFLKVETINSDMSFAVSARDGQLEYSGSMTGIFAQKRNLLNIKFYKMLKDIIVFFLFGYKYAFQVKDNESIGEYVKRCKFSEEFVNDHLIPMSSAIWSCPEKEILNFPAKTLLTFFKNHQLINFIFRPKWRTVKGGSRQYVNKVVEKIKKNKKNKFVLNSKIKSIFSKNNKIEINLEKDTEIFDKVIMATHPDQTIKLIKNLDKKSTDILSKFKYQKNTVYLHSDKNLMPKNKKTWSSWNYISSKKEEKSSVTYWMNLLQKINNSLNVFVSLNPYIIPSKSLTYKKIIYEHPIFNSKTNEAQSKMIEIQGKNNIFYVGAWLKYGFHEDGIASAVNISKTLNVAVPWEKRN
ncbi:FAD-dependent oxidoreductase [Alphaproteobacteria bacterium]|nr:FAD-dependent oxidoreductase [Alphaproteobacteria bacterium]